MRTTRVLVIAAIALAMCVAMTACGNGGATEASPGSESTSATPSLSRPAEEAQDAADDANELIDQQELDADGLNDQ